jgi:hypothetical protein
MTSVRTISLPATPFRRTAPRQVNRPLLAAIAIFLAVLIADIAIIAAAVPNIAALGSLYITST